MQRILLLMIGLVLSISSISGDLNESNSKAQTPPECRDYKDGCKKIESSKQQSLRDKKKEPATFVPQIEATPTNFELSKQSIDNLFISENEGNGMSLLSKRSTIDSEELSFTKKDILGEKIARAARVDCRTKYVRPDPNLLLVFPLLFETVTGQGCKW